MNVCYFRVSILIILLLESRGFCAISEERLIYKLVKMRIEEFRASPNGLAPSWEGAGNGGYILKSRIDLNGDGKKELLLSSTLDLYQEWSKLSVFREEDDGRFTEYNNVWNNPPGHFYYGRDQEGEMVTANHLSFREEGLSVTQFKNLDIVGVLIPHGNMDTDEAYRNFRQGWPLVKIPTLGIKLSDYVVGKDNWKSFSFKAAPDTDGHFRLAEDSEEMLANEAFTPEVAYQAFIKTFPVPPVERPAAERGDLSYPLPAHRPVRRTIPEDRAGVGSAEKSGWYWLSGILAMLVIVVGIWIFSSRASKG